MSPPRRRYAAPSDSSDSDEPDGASASAPRRSSGGSAKTEQSFVSPIRPQALRFSDPPGSQSAVLALLYPPNGSDAAENAETAVTTFGSAAAIPGSGSCDGICLTRPYTGPLRLSHYEDAQRAAAYAATEPPREPLDERLQQPAFSARKTGLGAAEDAFSVAASEELAARVERLLRAQAAEERELRQRDPAGVRAAAKRAYRHARGERDACEALVLSAERALGEDFGAGNGASSGANLGAGSGASIDVAALRRLLGQGSAEAARFGSDARVAALKKKLAEVETILSAAKSAAADGAAAERYLSAESNKIWLQRLHKEPETLAVISAAHLAEVRRQEAEIRRKEAEIEAERRRKEQEEARQRQAAAAAATPTVTTAVSHVTAGPAPAAAAGPAAAAAGAAREGYRAEAEESFAALEESKKTVAAVEASADPTVKRLRLKVKQICRGNFNRLSTDPQQVKRTVETICSEARTLLSDAAAVGGQTEAYIRCYLYNGLAQQVISRAEGDQFDAGDYEVAWPVAIVAVELSALEPAIGKMIRDLLRRACPYLVPALTVDTTGLNDAEVYSVLGYKDGESREKHGRRMQNLVVAAGTIMQAPLPRGADQSLHPLPLREGWLLLARLLNQLERLRRSGAGLPAPSAPVLDAFLRATGHALGSAYGQQLQKLVAAITEGVLPHIADKAVAPHLLDSLLRNYSAAGGSFEPPAGRHMLERSYSWGKTLT